jgi:hypothetical protein
MKDYTQLFPEGERDMPERMLTDEELATKRRLARLQYFARLERQTFRTSELLNNPCLPF